MASLTGTKISETYKDLLQVSNSNAGIDGTVRTVSDGEATASILGLSTAYVTCGTIRFNSSGTIDTTSGAITLSAATTLGGTTTISGSTTVSGALTLNSALTTGGSFSFASPSTVRTALGAAASGSNTDITSVYLNNTGLKIKDTNASHGLSIICGTNLTSDTNFTLLPTTGVNSYLEYASGMLGLILSGAYAASFTFTGTTNVTFPTSGTLSTTTGTVTSVAGAGLATGTVTSSGNITVTAATSSDQETATSSTTVVTPSVQQRHPSAAKFWANAVGSSGSLNASYNVTSTTDNGTGDTTFTYTTAFSSGNYAVNVSGLDTTYALALRVHSISTSACRIQIFDDGAIARDITAILVSGFGDQ